MVIHLLDCSYTFAFVGLGDLMMKISRLSSFEEENRLAIGVKMERRSRYSDEKIRSLPCRS